MIVGRSAETRLLLELVEHGPGSALLLGPPGIGKTGLCEYVSDAAREAGARVAWGRAWEFGGAPPFFPWLRVFATLAEADPETRAELQAVVARLNQGSEDADARARLALFEAARGALARVSSTTPLVLVLDDLHAADAGTLQLARYLQREASEAAITLIMTGRDAETEAATGAEGALLADLGRGATRVVRLEGLPEAALDEWLPWFCGRRAPDGLAKKLVEVTGGNPFFVRELIAAQRGDLEAITEGKPEVPRGVREVIRRQLAFLDDATRGVLRAAAVFGRVSRMGALAHVLGRPVTSVVAAREEAVAARLVAPAADDELRFAHALVCDSLYSDLPAAERGRLHAAIGDALPVAHLSERTRHALAAVRLGAGQAGRAFALCREAGAHAYRTLAFEEAARHFSDALSVAVEAAAPPGEIADVSVSCGEALAAAGTRDDAAVALGTAVRLALAVDDARLIARAAIAWATTREYTRRDVDKLELLERALARLGSDESDVAARLLARLATDLAMLPGSRPRRIELGARAVAMARRVGTSETIALALEAKLQAGYGPDNLDERLTTSDEILSHARSRGDRDREIAGLGWKLSALLERGELAPARALAAEHARLADARRVPGPRINARSRLATLAFLGGRFDEGLELAAAAREIGLAARDGASDLLYRAQLVLPAELLGRRDLLEAGLDTLASEGERVVHTRSLRALYARSLLALGRANEARAEIAVLGANAFEDVPDDFVRVGTLASLCDTVTKLGDVAAAAILGRLLAPHREQNAMIGTATSLGAVARYLGLVALSQGRDEDAEQLLRDALDRNRAMQARPWQAWTELDLGLLLQRHGAGDEARSLLAASRALAAELGLLPLIERHRLPARDAEAPSASAASAASAAGRHEPAASRSATFRREGKGWLLICGDQTLRFPDRRGFSYVARLIARPREEVHAVELLSASADAPKESMPDELLDARAKAQLRARLHDLREQVEEAKECGDLGRAERARAELEALEEQLAAALGLGGRSRRHGSAAERARIAVTVAIRRALDTLQGPAPEIATHLARSLKTGLFCAYDPDPSAGLRVTTGV